VSGRGYLVSRHSRLDCGAVAARRATPSGARKPAGCRTRNTRGYRERVTTAHDPKLREARSRLRQQRAERPSPRVGLAMLSLRSVNKCWQSRQLRLLPADAGQFSPTSRTLSSAPSSHTSSRRFLVTRTPYRRPPPSLRVDNLASWPSQGVMSRPQRNTDATPRPQSGGKPRVEPFCSYSGSIPLPASIAATGRSGAAGSASAIRPLR
jgi:hypothetical protein